VGDGTEPVEDDELIYRRIPEVWCDPDTRQLDDQAFAPHKTNDVAGLSLSRAKYKTIEEAAKGWPGKTYYVAILKAKDLRANDIAIESRPLHDDPGHIELPSLNSKNRRDSRVLELQAMLAELTLSVEGPFGPS
jgi:hypothetical protein